MQRLGLGLRPTLLGRTPNNRRRPATCRRGGKRAAVCFFSTEALRHANKNLGPFSSMDEELRSPVLDPAPQEPRPPQQEDFKESSRKYFRTVFDFDRWQSHRSTERYGRHMLGMLHSRLIRGLAKPMLYVVGVAASVALYESLLQAGVLPGGLFPDLQLDGKETFSLTSFALSLLLVFRTNASYSRWLDARKAWGLVLNRSRDLARQGLSWIPQERRALRAMLCRWIPAFSRTLMCHVRRDGNLERELTGILLPREVEAVLGAEHKPSHVLQVLSTIVRSSHVSSPAAMRMDENLSLLEDCLGTCERILKTPIPLSYTRHTSRFMMIWLTLLPFTMWESCGWSTVPLCGIIAFLLLGIEEIGVQIEEPFSILALEAICDSALSNVRELHATHSARSSGGTGVDGDGLAKQEGSTRRVLSADELVELAEAEG